jgi:hypothetical protein
MITLEAPARGRGVALPEQQAQRAYEALDRYGDDLAGHVYLRVTVRAHHRSDAGRRTAG